MLNKLGNTDFIKSIHEELESKKIPEYLGTRVFYSKFIPNPTYLLIGLNPGPDIFADYENRHGQKMCNLEEFDSKNYSDCFDYWESSSPIIQSIKELFINAGRGNEFDKMMITNCNFQGTKSTQDFYKLIQKINMICREKFNDTPYTDIQGKILRGIISEINPKYIIFLGKAFDFYENQLSPAKPLKANSSACNLKEVILNINNQQQITAVKFPRSINGIDNAHKDACVQWLKEH